MKKLISILCILVSLAAGGQVGTTSFVAFDVETTGFSPASERIVEIGAVKYLDGQIIQSTHWLINPGMPIKNSHVHGITDEMVAGCPGFSETYREFQDFVGNGVLIAHNASFDVRFMTAEIKRNQLVPLPNPTLNSLTLFRRWFPDAPSHKLGELAKHLGIPVSVAHRAEDDSATLLHILKRGIEARPSVTLEQIKTTANGTYHFDGSRKK